jgi:hypothetical protein
MARHQEAERRADYRSGVLASLISGFGGKPKHPRTWFPSLKPKRMGIEAMLSVVKSIPGLRVKER